MGLFGGDSNSTNTTVTNFSAQNTSSFSSAGSGAGSINLNNAPVSEGSGNASFAPDITSYYAPLNVTSSGAAIGDTALQTLQKIAAAQQSPSSSSSWFDSLFSGSGIYYVFAAVFALVYFLHRR